MNVSLEDSLLLLSLPPDLTVDIARMPLTSPLQPAKRRRVVTSCSECYRRKQKCDRKTPCNNCLARSVPTKCVYDVPNLATQAKEPEPSCRSTSQAGADSVELLESVEERPQDSVDLGYSLHSDGNTFMGLQEVLGNEEFHNVTVAQGEFALPKVKTQALLGKLPPRPIVEALVNFYFDAVNWHYSILEKVYFDSLLSRWPPAEGMEPVGYLTAAELSTELRYFPALLCQVIALSLQFVPADWDVLAGLPTARESASQKYSNLGHELLSLLGKPGLAITAVQADLLRSSWLKNCGRGIESWHTLGSAIRQGQELGLHRQKNVHQAHQVSVGKTLNFFWYEENKKRLWAHLFIWDSLMAMVLGRPRMINADDCDVKLPMDCNIPKNPSTAIPMTVRPEDIHVPIEISAPLFRHALACKVHKMRATKADSPLQHDYSVVQKLHEETKLLINEVPAFLQLKNPDTTWDREHPYVPQLRQELQVTLNLFLMALHRPHVISNIESRRAALQAALQTLDCQKKLLAQASKFQYHLFGLAFYTVDASFLICTIAMLFPPSSPRAKQQIDQSLQQAMEDLYHLQSSNPIARSGLDILQRCYQKLKRICESPSSTSEPMTTSCSTHHDGLHDLINDLGPQGFGLDVSQPETSHLNADSWPESPDLLSWPIPDTFDQRYWVDQLNMMCPTVGDQADLLWEDLNFD